MSTGPLVVIGDTVLDVDVEGDSERLCPDSPVPVVDVARDCPRPGGAGLAALLAARGHPEVVLVTALAEDGDGRRLRRLLGDRVEVLAIPADGGTPCKTRVLSGNQPVVRLDSGDGRARAGPLTAEVLAAIRSAGGLLVSDYGRGVASHPEIRRAVAGSRVPLLWDPHPKGARPVPGARLVTPNEREAAAFAADRGASSRLAAAGRRAQRMVRAWRAAGVAVTLGEQGALLSVGADAPFLAPAPRLAPPRQVDTCGAGDCFAATAAAALVGGALLREAVAGAVIAATRFIAEGGVSAWCRPPPPGHAAEASATQVAHAVRASGGTVVATGGCFDLLHAGHVGFLQQARQLGECLVVCVNSDASVRRLKGPGRPLLPAADRTRVLQALEHVDAVVIFDEDTPEHLLRRLRPHLWVKGGDYAGTELPEAATVRRLGGEVVLLPYLDGRSTSGIVSSIREGNQR